MGAFFVALVKPILAVIRALITGGCNIVTFRQHTEIEITFLGFHGCKCDYRR